MLFRQIERAAALGYEVRTGVECEFFVLSPDGAAVGDSGDQQSKPCYDQLALMRRYDLISKVCDGMLALGWGPYQNDHEDANGQFEMNWTYSDALTTADRHAFFKYMVKTMAEAQGLRATFMPKPFTNLSGNGCHVHVSLWVAAPRQREQLWSAPRAEAGFTGAIPGSALRAGMQLSVAAPLERDDFYLRGLGRVYRPPGLVARLSLGVELGFD